MERRNYPKPPIIEAIVELRFRGEISLDLLRDNLLDVLADYVPDAERERVDINARFSPDGNELSAKKRRDVAFLKSKDGTRVIGCRDSKVSVHVLPPYPGWENFRATVERIVGALPTDADTGDLDRVSVRYIDRIQLPAGASFADFFVIYPKTPKSLSGSSENFQWVREGMDDDGYRSRLIFTGGANTDGPFVLYDLEFSFEGDGFLSVGGSEWIRHVELMHDRQRNVFEECITDLTRGLFQ